MKKTLIFSILCLFIAAHGIASEGVTSIKEDCSLVEFLLAGLDSNELGLEKKPPRGNNYIENGHLFVWYKGKYLDMGEYHP